jgi:hypothetical protein
MHMLRHNLHKVLLVVLSCFIVLLFTVPAHAAGAVTVYPNGMLTPPPPASDMVARYVSNSSRLSINSTTLSASDIYLNLGITTIGKTSSGDIGMSGTTTAYSIVSTIGVKLSLQQWSGSSWTSIYTSSDTTSSNAASVTMTASRSAAKGYYYRLVGTHWVSHNGTYESGTYTGESYAYN